MSTAVRLPEKVSRGVASLVTARQEVIERLGTKHPALDDLGVKSFARDGEARISHRPATTEAHVAALAALYSALLKA